MSISSFSGALSKPFQDLGNSVKTPRKLAAIPGEAAGITAATPAAVTIGVVSGSIEGAIRAFEPTTRSESVKVRDFVVPTFTLRGTALAATTGALAATVFPAAGAMAQNYLGIDVGTTALAGAGAGVATAMGWNGLVGAIKGGFDGLAAVNGVRKAFGSATQCIADKSFAAVERVAGALWNNGKRDAHKVGAAVDYVAAGTAHIAGAVAEGIADVAKGAANLAHHGEAAAERDAAQLEQSAPKRESYLDAIDGKN